MSWTCFRVWDITDIHYTTTIPTISRCTQNLDCQVEQQVYIKALFFCTMWPSKKLSEKYLGLFGIISQASTHSFMICLLKSIYTVYLVFHMSMLKPATSNTFYSQSKLLLSSVVIDGEIEYEISQIIGLKIDHSQVYKLLYKIIWLEYKIPEEESDWLPASELAYASNLIADFYQAYLNKPTWINLVLFCYPNADILVSPFSSPNLFLCFLFYLFSN